MNIDFNLLFYKKIILKLYVKTIYHRITKIINMKITGEIKFEYESGRDAKLVYESLEIDNENFLKSEINNNTIIYQIDNNKLGTFLATADDLIASEIVAENIIKIK